MAGRLCAAQGKKDGAREHYAKAAELVKKCGYHRRDGDVEELKRIADSV
jgi:predicted negative regulator of RcsB-dependent stress response